MIHHFVLLDLPDDYDRIELASVVDGLSALRDEIEGFIHFDHGPNRDFEKMSPHCAYVFVCHFADENTSREWLVNPGHNALGQRLVNMCRGGVDGITVVDMAVVQ